MKIDQVQANSPYFGNNTVIVDKGIKQLGSEAYRFASLAAKTLKAKAGEHVISIERGFDSKFVDGPLVSSSAYDPFNVDGSHTRSVFVPIPNDKIVVYVTNAANTFSQKVAKFFEVGKYSKTSEISLKNPSTEDLINAGLKGLDALTK